MEIKFNEKEYKARYYQAHKEKIKEQNKIYYLKNKKRILEATKLYSKSPNRVFLRRNTQLCTTGKVLRGLNKRQYSSYCEMCGKSHKRLCYHHWNDLTPHIGIWLCNNCHWFVEGIEKGLQLKRYIDLKERIEQEYGIATT